MPMLIETFSVGMLSTNCYVASDHQTRQAIIIDPGLETQSEAEQIYSYIEDAELTVKFIVNTHGHDDHVVGNAMFQERFKVPICIHRLDTADIESQKKPQFPATVILEEGSPIQFGNETLKVMHTPGHTPGSIRLLWEKDLCFYWRQIVCRRNREN